MSTYPTYQAAKIANPEREIKTDNLGNFFVSVGHTTCNPADYCISLSDFRELDYEVCHGDLILGLDGSVIEVSNVHNYNKPWQGDDKRFILKAKALEETKTEVEMNTYETMKHSIPKGATHYRDECDNYDFCWVKFENKVLLTNQGLGWKNVIYGAGIEGGIKPIPQPTYRYEKVDDVVAGELLYVKDDDEYKNGLVIGWHPHHPAIVVETDEMLGMVVLGDLHRRIEVTEKELAVDAAIEILCRGSHDNEAKHYRHWFEDLFDEGVLVRVNGKG